MEISVKKKTRQPFGIRTAPIGLKPGADLPDPPTPRHEPRRGSGLQPRRGRAAASPGSCAHPGPLNATDPSGVPSGGGDPQTGARAWRSLLALSPACGHRPRASDLWHTRAPRIAALGIPGLHAASPLGLSCDSTAPYPAPFVTFVPFVVPHSKGTRGHCPRLQQKRRRSDALRVATRCAASDCCLPGRRTPPRTRHFPPSPAVWRRRLQRAPYLMPPQRALPQQPRPASPPPCARGARHRNRRGRSRPG